MNNIFFYKLCVILKKDVHFENVYFKEDITI